MQFRALNYEHILRRIAALKTGKIILGERMEDRGALNGLAEAGLWNSFEMECKDQESYDIIVGILKCLDIIREKIEELDNKLKRLET